MKPDEKQQFAAMMGELAAAFEVKLKPERIAIYWENLRDIPLGAIGEACRDLVLSGHRFPLIADIRQRCEYGVAVRAAEAWGEVVAQLHDCRKGFHSDPVVETVVRQMGGWVYLGTEVSTDDLHTWQSKKFRELYTEQSKRAEIDRRLGPVQLQPAVQKTIAEVASKIGGGE